MFGFIHRKTKIGTEVSHVTRTPFSRSKGQVHRGRGILDMPVNTLEKMVVIHANTKLIDKVTDVCYEEPSASWELEPEPDSEDAEAETYDTDSTSEIEYT